MTVRARLIFLLLSLVALLAVGGAIEGSLRFVLTQFWFTSGFFLLILLSLVDQPHFSKDANVFVNAATAWVSLLLVPSFQRGGIWWTFFAWAAYLIVSSYVLLWVRRHELLREPQYVQIISRLNRQIGRPEAIFSSFFLWGAILQFGTSSGSLSALFVFWAVFMILNLPALSRVIDSVFSRRVVSENEAVGLLDRVISPRIAEVSMSTECPKSIIGRDAELRTHDGRLAATAVVIDDRVVAQRRISRLAITSVSDNWSSVGEHGTRKTEVLLLNTTSENANCPISIVDTGSEIGKLAFIVHPEQDLQSGEVVWTDRRDSAKVFYQAISAKVREKAVDGGNAAHTVNVIAGELGAWDERRSRFEPINWVAPAGRLVYRIAKLADSNYKVPATSEIVGCVPNSRFPVHVLIEDVVTHNTAIVGVTGSGKSFLAFHLIEGMAKRGIKVLVLDISRQHDIYLTDLKPTPLKTASEVGEWYASASEVGIHQYAGDAGYPKTTADFVASALNEVSRTKLERGKNIPAKLCVVVEEAHSLIPEWNQVAQEGDKQQVNRTCRAILQGRKYGMGALVITQRTANVTKTILNQCNTIFAMQSFDQTGLDFLRNYMGDEYSQAISTLPARHAILVGKASSSARPLLFRVDDWTDRWREENAGEEVAGEFEEDERPRQPSVENRE
jgi:hypothetical protein